MTAESTELGELLQRCADRWSERLVERCASAGHPGVTATTCRVLSPLFESDELPISVVGERAGLAKSSMTTIVRRLAREGWVRVIEDPDDQRVKRLALTPRGRELERAIGDAATRLRHRVTATLGPRGQRDLHRTLERLHERI